MQLADGLAVLQDRGGRAAEPPWAGASKATGLRPSASSRATSGAKREARDCQPCTSSTGRLPSPQR
ncbi:hypothetical protein ACFQ1I_24585 [Kitasatospora arboriphila]